MLRLIGSIAASNTIKTAYCALEAAIATNKGDDFDAILGQLTPAELLNVLGWSAPALKVSKWFTEGHYTLAARAARCKNPHFILQVMNKLNNEETWALCQLRDGDNSSALHSILINPNISVIEKLFLKLDKKHQAEAFQLKCEDNHNPLHRASRNSNPDCLLAVISNIDEKVFSEILLKKADSCSSPLITMIEQQPIKVLIASIMKLSSQSLLKILKTSCFPLVCAGRMPEPKQLLEALLKRLEPDDLKTALKIKYLKNETLLHQVAYFGGKEILAFHAKLEPKHFWSLMLDKNTDSMTPLEFTSLLSNREFLLSLFQHADTETLLSLLEKRSSHLKPVLRLIAESYFNEGMSDIRMKFPSDRILPLMSDIIWLRIQGDDTPIEEFNHLMLTALLARPCLDMNHSQRQLLHYCKLKTTLSNEDFQQKIEAHLQNSLLAAIMIRYHTDFLALLRLPLSETPFLPRNNIANFLAFQMFQNMILIKIVAPEHHEEYLKQLCDYNYRPVLRAEKNQAQYKFVHLSGEVVPYKKHTNKNKPAYSHTKKSSATLIGAGLQTPVFGQRDITRPLVGYLYNKQDCVIKAMLKQDKGTFLHQWLAQTEILAQTAGRIIPDYNFTKESEFLDSVNNDNPHITNEVLAKVKKEAIVAVVIARNTPECVDLAKKRQLTAHDKLGLNIPIVFYDSDKSEVTLIQDRLYEKETCQSGRDLLRK